MAHLLTPTETVAVSLVDVTKRYGRKTVFDRVSIDFPHRHTIALMGGNGAGKSTLLRLISGAEQPDSGIVRRAGTISWPVGLTSGYNSSMTGIENALFVARLYGADPDFVVDYVSWFSELGPAMRQPIRTYSSGMKSRFGFGLSMAFDFDIYLVDEAMSVGDTRFRDKCLAVFQDKIGPADDRRAGMILISHSQKTIQEWCECGFLLADGALRFYPDTEALLSAYRNLS